MLSKAADLLLPRSRTRESSGSCQKCSSFPGTMGVFSVFFPYDKVCSLKPQFGPVTKQKIFSLPHSSRMLSSEQLWASFFYLFSFPWQPARTLQRNSVRQHLQSSLSWGFLTLISSDVQFNSRQFQAHKLTCVFVSLQQDIAERTQPVLCNYYLNKKKVSLPTN